METAIQQLTLPRTLAEFDLWEPGDGFKYEWNDGEMIKFEGIKRKHLRLIHLLMKLFRSSNACKNDGELMQEQDVMLTGIQLRRPDLAYFSSQQINAPDYSSEPIPEFVIEIISTFDQIIPVKNKLKEYFSHGVKVAWLIYPDDKLVEIYTSFKNITVCTDNDICSAKPVLDDFEITVNELFV